jgi:hypothetical protein
VSPFQNIPLFPLNIFLLPKEKVSLHIFEKRYQQLLLDCEQTDTGFGIYFAHGSNKLKIGSYVRLNKIANRYPTGESDIEVQCESLFTLSRYSEYYKGKLYAGGAILPYYMPEDRAANASISGAFKGLLSRKNQPNDLVGPTVYEIAGGLKMDIQDKIRFIGIKKAENQESFLSSRLEFMQYVLDQELNSAQIYHLN